MNWLISEDTEIRSKPLKISKTKRNNIRMECVIQTEGVRNKNFRKYPKAVLESGINDCRDMIEENALLGEMDHPITKDPSRQGTVLYEKVSHVFKEFGWDGNKLIAVIETLSNFNGRNLRNIALDGVPIGWSFRGMGELKKIIEGSDVVFEVTLPIKVITWDAVTNPSHHGARIIRLNESTVRSMNEWASARKVSKNSLTESADLMNSYGIHDMNGITEKNGMICTSEGICYLPNQFDEFVNKRVISLVNKFK